MALTTTKGNFTKSTGGAPASQAVTGVGFTPKALFLWATPQTAAGIAGGYQLSLGASDGAIDFSACGTSEDAQATSDTDIRHVVKILTMMDFAQTIIAECDLTSFDADGFTVNWTTNDANAYVIHYLAIGGADLTNVDVDNFEINFAAGNQSITGVGFQPDCLIFFGVELFPAPPSVRGGLAMQIGFAISSTERAVISWASANAISTMSTGRIQKTDECLAYYNAGGTRIASADLVSMDSDGFTINKPSSGSSRRVGFLALRGGQYSIGTETQKTSTGTKAKTGVGFQPTGLLLAGFNRASVATHQVHNRISVGAASAAGTEGGTWAGDTDALADSSTDMATSTTKVFTHIDTDAPSAVDAEADLSSFDSDGFTLDWTTADAVAREFLFLAMGDAAAVAALLPRPVQVRQAVNRASVI